MDNQTRRAIPAVHRFTDDDAISAYRARLGQSAVRTCVQEVIDAARRSLLQQGAMPEFDALRDAIVARLAAREAEGLLGVINATGVLLHTNFGRAPLAASALASVSKLGSGYTNLEFDLESGERGSRYDRVASQLQEVSGAEAALVVNNCAAAVLLVLDTFARGREVVVSRGQLIEIGGAFRLPDVLRKSGATLVEVGTTNRTYGADYRNAWTANTAIFMRTHPSNYRVEGFTAEVDASSLAALAKELGIISFEDLGSGALVDLTPFGLPHEPTLADEIAAGIDLVAVSGDKLMGGPQCGILAGRRTLVDAMRRNPLLRALRVDKMTIAALSATLGLYLEPGRLKEIPLYWMLSATQEELLRRAEAVCNAVGQSIAIGQRADTGEYTATGHSTAAEQRAAIEAIPVRMTAAIEATPVRTTAVMGGGSLPSSEIASAGLSVMARGRSPDTLAETLRRGRPPVIGRVVGEAVVFDLRTVRPAEDALLADAIAAASICV